MGSGSSKTEKYVLRVGELPAGGGGSSVIRSNNSAFSSPGSLSDASAIGEKSAPTSKRHSSAKSILPGSSKTVYPAESPAGSPAPSPSPIASPDTPELRKTINSKGASLLAKATNSSVIVALGGGGMKVSGLCSSSRFPWLLKGANISCPSDKEMDFGRVIGTGLMGFVRVAKFKNSRQYFAVKGIRKDYIIRHRDERHVQNERNILLQLKSEFCVKLFGTFQDNNCIYFIMELVIGGELFRRLSKKECFMPQTAKFYATEICCALIHIHKLGWCYRDLKPENVMVDEEGHCKLVDFGFSRECGPDEMMHTVCGTPAYLSPEQLNGKFTNGYSRIVDWWALGVFIFELLTGNTPFSEDNSETPYAIYLRILNSQISFPMGFDPIAKDFVASLCRADLARRLVSDAAIMSHSYFVIDWKDVKEKRLIPPFVPKISTESDLHYFENYPDPHFKESSDHSQMFEGF